MNLFLVAAGGFIGSILRFFISVKLNKRLIGTWIANITGSIMLSILVHFHLNNMLHNALWLLLGVGFCGAYTTFSTFGNETLQLIINKKYGIALSYVISSLVVSLFFVYLVVVLL